MNNLDHCAQFQQAVKLRFDTSPPDVKVDGQIHRFSTKPGNVTDRAGWYILFWNNAYNITNGVFGCWRSGLIREKWCSKEQKHLNEAEKKWYIESQKTAIDIQKKARDEDN